MSNPLKKPSIFDFLDTILYLQSYFDWRKRLNTAFSYSLWCEELNLGNKTTLRFLLQRKRRISAKVAKNLKVQLNLDRNEELYFDYLLLYSQPRIEAERVSAGAKLIEMQRSNFKSEEYTDAVVEVDLLGPLVLTLIMFKDFSATEDNIAKFFSLESVKVKSILDSYLKSGHLHYRDGVYTISTECYKINDQPHSKALKSFHRFWLTKGQKSLDLDFKLRRVRSLNFALNQQEFETFVNQLNDFAISILSKFNHGNLSGRRLYMFQSVLFPVVEKIFSNSVDAQNSQVEKHSFESL
jgi:uncharacterized protein (TIGR02147 family)